jgi:hypothetical protein
VSIVDAPSYDENRRSHADPYKHVYLSDIETAQHRWLTKKIMKALTLCITASASASV